jgi:ABC-type lipoprotein release transport system permease subunit
MTWLRFVLMSVLRRRLALVLVVLPTTILFMMLTVLIATFGTMRLLDRPSVDARGVRVGVLDGVSPDRTWFSPADVAHLAKIPGVILSPEIFSHCHVNDNEKSFECTMCGTAYAQIWDNDMHNSLEDLERWDAVPNGVILTRPLADLHHWKVGDHITLHENTAAALTLELVVTSISETYRNPMLAYVHTKYHEQLAQTDEKFWVVWILVDQAARRPEVMKQVNSILELHPHVVWKMEQAKQFITSTSEVIRSVFIGAGVLSVLLILCITVTLLIVSIEQRTAEFATLRALGFRAGTLARSTLWEGAMLLLPGALLGGLAVYWKFHGQGLVFDPLFQVVVTPFELLLGIACGPALGLIAAIVPAWRVLRIDVLTALR